MTKKVSALLAVVGILGVLLLVLDTSLREYAPSHLDVLVAFAIIDFALAALVATKPSRTTLLLAIVWSVVQTALQFGDILLGTSLGFDSNAQFANYLFNPLYHTEDNPPGVPGAGALLDLITLLQLVTISVGLKARKALGQNPVQSP
jgi:hypothetical protein